MIELASSVVDIVVVAITFVFILVRLNQTRSRAWLMLAFAWACMLFADIYWAGYLAVFGETPPYFYVAEIGWGAMYLFLVMLLAECNIQRSPSAPVPAAWIPVVIAAAFTVYFVSLKGNILFNLLDDTAMAGIGYFAVKGLAAPPGPGFRGNRAFAGAALFLVMTEFAVWTASCFYDSGGFMPYIVLSYILTLSQALIIVCAWKSEHV
ncbi:MAG: hypothetical protein Q4D27_07685 [Coriobacteriia bacterium]|nr:hypothetical protein [Coriobacteriia bacterium]